MGALSALCMLLLGRAYEEEDTCLSALSMLLLGTGVPPGVALLGDSLGSGVTLAPCSLKSDCAAPFPD